ncbi:helix-turn-helix domain-containing protein [Actinoplanes sp. NPDC051633]|uniref:TetR/AcrR family transcriptional regulator n=1 Tax=Actinoplanes sp. NPDC051633 TaxID=3155670 RepID=UPI003433F4D6
MADLTLRERKQQRARQQIIDAAFALFAERGFANVSVTDIAERAEVGRSTFFRYFGDKQEVVFSDEADLLEAIDAAPPGEAAPDLTTALVQVCELTEQLAGLVVGDPRRWPERERLLAANPELEDRANRKLQRVADGVQGVLLSRGTDAEVAVLAAELAVACFRAGRRTAGEDADAVMPAMRRAVTLLLGDRIS